MKDLTPIKGRYYIEELISQGEHVEQDFKFLISDARKIARSISAFANCGGGRLLIGVKDNGIAAGVRNEEDIYVVEQAASTYCDPPQHVDFKAFKMEPGVIVIKADIIKAERRPVLAQDVDRRWKAYYRVKDENIIAHPLMVRSWKRMADDGNRNSVFSLTSAESDLLALLDDADSPLSSLEIALRLHLPAKTADELIVGMASMGILDFTYVGQGEFRIIRAD